jgi:Ran GTPase-activating protein (RanGAP) involved in mRNA processing and transport
MLASNRNLTELDLAFNSIEALGAESMSRALLTNRTLETLNLRQNNIGVTGGKFFADALSKNNHLRVLILVDNSLGTENICVVAGRLTGRFGDVAKSLRTNELDMPPIYEEGRFFYNR